MGVALVSGVAILILLIPFNTLTERYGAKYERSRMKCKDRRIRAMYEILNSIKIIKFNAWEESFADEVNTIRGEELAFLRRKYTLTSFINFVFGCVPIMVTLSSFGTYVAISEDNVLTADKVSFWSLFCLTDFDCFLHFPPVLAGVRLHRPVQPAPPSHAPAALGSHLRRQILGQRQEDLKISGRKVSQILKYVNLNACF